MGTYVMFGRYSRDGVRGAGAARTGEATALLEGCGGQVRAAYALLGRTDLMIIADFPGTEEAMKASVALAKLTGIAFTTSPAVAISEFDRLFD
jgi:uncharacterized protein with GYD domain